MENKVLPQKALFDTIDSFLGEGKRVAFIPDGRSMLPFIRGGRDSVVLARPDRPLEVGDIVLVHIHKEYVLHRIRASEGGELLLMGDGNLGQKERCKPSEVLGIVTEIVKADGRRVKPGKGSLWRMLLPVRPLLLAILKRTVFKQDFKDR